MCTPMFIASLFIIAKMWKQTKYLLMDEWINTNMAYTYNGILFSLKKEGNSDTCYNMDGLEAIVLSEISQLKNTNTL